MFNSMYPIVLCLGLALAAPALAADDVDVRGAFAQQAAVIRADLSNGEPKYAELSSLNRTKVLEALTRIERELERGIPVEKMMDHERMAILTDQELVNTILSGAREDSRLICQRTQVTGTHRKQNVCMTAAQRERQREQDQANTENVRRRTEPQMLKPN